MSSATERQKMFRMLKTFPFKTDAEFLTEMAKKLKVEGNIASDETLKTEAKRYREIFSEYGYTGAYATDAVPNEAIERYNEMKERRNKNLIIAESYEFGPNKLKLDEDYTYLPDSVKSLGDLFNNYEAVCRYESAEGNFVGNCQYSRNIYYEPDIEIGDGKVVVNSSISGNTVKSSKMGSWSDSLQIYVYRDQAQTLKGTAEKVGNELRVTLKGKFTRDSTGESSWQTVGTVVIPYATAQNADATSGVSWTDITAAN